MLWSPKQTKTPPSHEVLIKSTQFSVVKHNTLSIMKTHLCDQLGLAYDCDIRQISLEDAKSGNIAVFNNRMQCINPNSFSIESVYFPSEETKQKYPQLAKYNISLRE